MKELTTCGKVCFLFNGLLLVIFGAVTVSATWWSVYFWDCSIQDDYYYYISLDEGYCFDTKEVSGDYKECEKWKDLEDVNVDDDAVNEDATKYIDAYGLCGAALAFAIISFVLLATNFIIPTKFAMVSRFSRMGLLALTGLMFLCSIGIASDTWYTDIDNYGGLKDICDSNATFMNAGWACAMLGMIFAGATSVALFIPMCGCANADSEDLTMSLTGDAVPSSTA
jgi:hypothetical protein